MAREIESFREVTSITPKQSGQVQQALIEESHKILATQQEAKTTEMFSNIQLDLNALNSEYQIQNESDPFAGQDKYKAERQKLFDRYEKDVSPLQMRYWQDSVRKLSKQSDGTLQVWGLNQARKNTVGSINTSITNNLNQAMADGQNFGISNEATLESSLNFKESRDSLLKFGSENLGSESTAELLKNYSSDYTKTFLSGVADVNPVKALSLMGNKNIKSAFDNPAEYKKMQDAINHKSIGVNKFNAEKEVLNTMSVENSTFVKSLQKPLTYSELQQAVSQSGMSKPAQDYLMQANGFSSGAKKISNEDKMLNKLNLHSDIMKFLSKEKMDSKTISSLQDSIYTAMGNRSITKTEGLGYLDQLITPVAEERSSEANNWVQDWLGTNDDMGLRDIETYYEDNIEVKDAGVLNSANKIRIFDNYNSLLAEEAAKRDIKVADITKLSEREKSEIYKNSYDQAIKIYAEQKTPALRRLNDTPNQVVQDGKVIQASSGKRDLEPAGVIKLPPTQRKMTDKDGNSAIVEVDKNGKFVKVIRELP